MMANAGHVTGGVQNVLQGMGTKHVGGSRRRIVLVVGWYDAEAKRSVYDYFEAGANPAYPAPSGKPSGGGTINWMMPSGALGENDPILARLQRPGPKLIQ